MSRQCCFLCASDEGVFLDVTTDNKQQYYDQFEICSFVKIPRADQLPAKICHKCAYELNQCSSFVQKYIRAKKKQKPNVRKHCGLCCEPAKNEFIFDLSKEKKLQYNPFHKIQEIFDKEQIGNIQKNKFICLPCRYVIDVLIDLMNICEETAMRLEDTANKKTNLNKVDQLIFPKIKTAVVSRKTTTTDSARINLHTLHESTSDFGEMTRTRSRNNKLNEKTKLQVCNKCHSSIKTDDDMYKTQKTGKLDIVCKNCWKNMDIHKTEKQVQQNSTEIKLCTVFLKDVLKDIDIKEKKTYIVTDKNLENKNKSNKTINNVGNDVGKQNQKRSVKSLKTADEDTSDGDVPNKKYKSDAKEVSETNLEQLNTNIQQQQTTATQHTKITQKRDTRDTDSRVTRRQGRTLTKYKRATGSSLSDADVDNKHNRKRLKTILSGIPIMKSIDVNDESSNEGVILKRKRSRYTSTSSTIEISDDDTNQKKGLEKNVRRKKTNIKKLIKSSAVTSQELQSLNSENIFETQTYVCDECGASYENKLTELTHKLTHYKQPELKLQKLNTEILTKTILGLSTVMDDQSEDLSETIAITVEDDEEELLENEIDLNINNHADTNDIENKIDSSKKEAVEDVVDVKLVMKEFDDDHKTEEKTEDLQKETKKEIEDLQKETEKDTENLQKETEKDTEDLQKEIEKDTEDLQKETEKKTEDLQKETEEETEDLQKQPEKETEDLQIESKEETEHSQEVTENLQETEKFTKKEIENLQIEEKETKDLHEVLEKNEIKEDKNEENEKEKNNFKIGERIHRSVDCLNSEQIIKILDNNDSENKQEEHKEKDIHENNEIKVEEKQIEIEVSEERETEKDGEKHINVEENKQDEVVCNGQQSQIVNQESSNKIDKDFVNNVPKKMEQSNIEHDRTRDETKVGVDDKDDITISTEQKSPKLTQKRKSFDENKIQTKINDSDFKKSEVLEENVLSKEDSTTDKQHVSVNVEIVESNSSKEEESTNDSITAAAEILQEVLDLASAKVEKRQEVLIDISTNIDSMETETLENISREIQNTVDM
ncbi:WEB family protein At5g16730, chloroplastic-like isoform X2 [Frieseomelitta varia]|uniref:WEB family protein At5g16730, chloroplastic-like isoform X2 n=1 Tax=Frieseomelitta varia TaxID=561572 RepID=UPI001CB6A28A|nr:WEB family protein At5g16730, chloroplastic-like isoform X2 [Frieseomelitta varia]